MLTPDKMNELYRTDRWTFFYTVKKNKKRVLAVSNDEACKETWLLTIGKIIKAKNQNKEEVNYIEDSGIRQFKEKFGIVPQKILRKIIFSEEHSITMMHENNELFWRNGLFTAIGGSDGQISLSGLWDFEYLEQYAEDYLDVSVPGLQDWFNRFYDCDLLKWEKVGLDFAKIIKRKLPAKWKLFYMTAAEDTTSGFTEETLVSNTLVNKFALPSDLHSVCIGLKCPVLFYTCAAYCCIHKSFLTVEDIGSHKCLDKHCKGFRGLWHHPFWKRHSFIARH